MADRRRPVPPKPPAPPSRATAPRIVRPDGRPARPEPRAAPVAGGAPPPGVRVVTAPMYVDTEAGEFVPRAPPPAPGLSRRAFDQELQRLLRAFSASDVNPGSVSCSGCRQCASCMFCTDCEECYRCTHSRGCRSSSHLTHCVDCTGCHDCAYCVRSENCVRSSYLVLSRACSECTYCFGCVGLVKKDFHVLNVPHGRTEYFRIVKELEAELGIAR